MDYFPYFSLLDVLLERDSIPYTCLLLCHEVVVVH
jgi:hypothetical protein